MTTDTRTRTMRLKDRASVLRFRVSDDSNTPPDGAYQCRGGICWPIAVDKVGSVRRGFAVMLGLHLDTRRLYLLGQSSFVTVDHVQDDQGRIEFEGLAPWFVDCWARWFADSYGWRQPWETTRRYLSQVLRSQMIQPKPHFIELDWDDDADAVGAVVEADVSGRLVYPAGSEFHKAWIAWAEAEPDERKRMPEVHAVACAVAAMQSVMPRGAASNGSAAR